MNTDKTGGAAFPTTEQDSSNRICTIHDGMTLLDYFAAKAMQGHISNIRLHDAGQYIIAKKAMKWPPLC